MWCRNIILFLALTIILSGCGNDNVSDYERLNEYSKSLKSYKVDVNMIVTNNEYETTYKITQLYKKDGLLKLEYHEPPSVSGFSVVFNGDKALTITNKGVKIPSKKQANSLGICYKGVLDEYFASPNKDIAYETINGKEVMVLNVTRNVGTNRTITKKVFLDKETLSPSKFVLLLDNKKIMDAEFSLFERDIRLDDGEFAIE